MSLSILCIGDLHVKVSNIETIRKVKHEIKRIIEEKSPNFVVFLGDMHDTFEKIHVQAWNEIVDFFETITDHHGRRKTIYLVGNHDMVNNQVFLSDDHFFNSFKNREHKDHLYIVDKWQEFSEAGLIFLPYTPPGRFQEALAKTEMVKSGIRPKIIFAHQEFKGVSFGPILSDKGDEWPEDAPMVISGHIHEHQYLQKNILYVGTPYQTNFGESEDKSISLITLDGDKITEERIRLNIPKNILHDVTVEEFKALRLNDFDKYKIIVSGTLEQISSLKKTKLYKEYADKCKVVTKIVSQSTVKKNINNLSFLDILKKEVDKESPTVKQIFSEVVSEINT